VPAFAVTVPETGTGVARSWVSVSGPVTATEPVIVVLVSETGTAEALSWVSVRGPETATVAAMLTGWVAWKKVPDTGWVTAEPSTATTPVLETLM